MKKFCSCLLYYHRVLIFHLGIILKQLHPEWFNLFQNKNDGENLQKHLWMKVCFFVKLRTTYLQLYWKKTQLQSLSRFIYSKLLHILIWTSNKPLFFNFFIINHNIALGFFIRWTTIKEIIFSAKLYREEFFLSRSANIFLRVVIMIKWILENISIAPTNQHALDKCTTVPFVAKLFFLQPTSNYNLN